MEQSKLRLRRCAVYTRKSSEEGLEQEFNSLHACEAFIKSQAGEGWRLVRTHYDDGGLSGATMERPALQRLMADIDNRLVDAVVVYKVDRLTRSLADFAKMVEVFDARGISFVAVTQQFNTTTSMGRLTLNVLLSFAQFEREVTGERIPAVAALAGRVPTKRRPATSKLSTAINRKRKCIRGTPIFIALMAQCVRRTSTVSISYGSLGSKPHGCPRNNQSHSYLQAAILGILLSELFPHFDPGPQRSSLQHPWQYA
jgi:DNA invertase Pin-like site-specific DNA recombinase